MITKPTTLILGAGASMDFGFPSGYALLNRVLGQCRQLLANHTNRQYFKEFHNDQITAFQYALSRSGAKSVDSFLEHRTEFIPLGKKLMAIDLICCEQDRELFRKDGKSWYEYLFDKLNCKFEDFHENKLSILTFNYDRSIEHYFLEAFQNTYGKPVAACVSLIKSLNITHLHGDLGELPAFNNTAARYYNGNVDKNILGYAANRIQIVHEGNADSPEFKRAREILNASKTICFLGFGYNETNIRRLGFIENMSYSQAHTTGSTMGLTAADCDDVGKLFNGRFTLPRQVKAHFCDTYSFLRESGVLNSSSFLG